MRPFLRWAGGKRWLTERNTLRIPEQSTLIEPFLGGGALFFSGTWANAILSDTNRFLINTYIYMRDDPSQLFRLVLENFDRHSHDRYYDVRSRMCSDSVQDAADFIYLNRACFNGLFRVNLAGKFNVPIGNKVYEIRDAEEFQSWSQKLRRAHIALRDFQEIISECGEGDFIFADPPYTVNHNSNGFIEYNEKIFSWDDQVRLHACLLEAAERGAHFAVTNADHVTVRDLYDGWPFQVVERGSEMASKPSARGRTTEIVITSS